MGIPGFCCQRSRRDGLLPAGVVTASMASAHADSWFLLRAVPQGCFVSAGVVTTSIARASADFCFLLRAVPQGWFASAGVVTASMAARPPEYVGIYSHMGM